MKFDKYEFIKFYICVTYPLYYQHLLETEVENQEKVFEQEIELNAFLILDSLSKPMNIYLIRTPSNLIQNLKYLCLNILGQNNITSFYIWKLNKLTKQSREAIVIDFEIE
ncbi:hypothetical protein TTHERM_00957520 (macronuclear) [Tetrahymena thermophila SB210]|uniref:Uncharacterized protein n=1 Tax=Tetrahymena thermophila (strain SB210) TaxID=312017 RepID=Q23VE9_TETTS|nr:hypothetical protein TTHERM_00957520 [Tetrahymena thermophila SB210]EAS00487.1 hypothetical protein TTHERM_00957520 [Tetrahymena thermophila SB210]|eukprot:XP_001020732.1 hypothetical protein TTHERM_00957520 [Tetrahymena thermophila SB210]